jgi:ABC-type lipoprotein export system ATPase subunit
MTRAAVLECEGLVHIYKTAEIEVVALQGLDLQLAESETLAVVGRSGSGKSTLMNILAGVEPPTAGRATVVGHDLNRMSDEERRLYRRDVVGYCRQRAARNLAMDLTSQQNVEVPMLASGAGGKEVRRRSAEMLEQFGIAHVSDKRPPGLNGDETQRLALAVALVNRPRLLLADELTAELDGATSRLLLVDLARFLGEQRTAAILVTHDPNVARHVSRVVHIRDGRISTESRKQEGPEQQSAELVVIDKAGRLQIPRDLLSRLGIHDRVRIALDGDHIRITPPDR